jgi:hypothetical protein
MKPVLIQNLMRNMRKRIHLPAPSSDPGPTKRDRSGQFVLIFLVLVIVAMFLI